MATTRLRCIATAASRLAAVSAAASTVAAGGRHGTTMVDDDVVRFATYNASLNRNNAGQLIADLSTPDNAQAKAVAEVIQRLDPDVLLDQRVRLRRGPRRARAVPGQLPRRSRRTAPSRSSSRTSYTAPSNTGVPSGFDLDNSGAVGGGNDALGFGFFPGQFGMAVYSKHPIDERRIRTFQHFLWKDMPGARLPDDPATAAPADWYSAEELAVFPLSSKSHWDIPIEVDRRDRPLPRQPSDPAGVRRPRGSQRHAERRRDPLLGRLREQGPQRPLHLRRRGSPRRPQRRRRSSSPATRTAIRSTATASPARSSSCSTTGGSTATFIPSSEGAVEQSALQGGANLTHRSDPRVRHRRLRRQRPRQPARRLRAAEPRPRRASTAACSGRCRPTRCSA